MAYVLHRKSVFFLLEIPPCRSVPPKTELKLSEVELRQLRTMARSRSMPAALTLRELVLACAEGAADSVVAERHGVTASTVSGVGASSNGGVLGCMTDRPGQPRTVDDERLATSINTTLHAQPRDGSTHWTIHEHHHRDRCLEDQRASLSADVPVAPHHHESFKLSTDPFFIEKLRDIVGLYLNPPDDALVLCVR